MDTSYDDIVDDAYSVQSVEDSECLVTRHSAQSLYSQSTQDEHSDTLNMMCVDSLLDKAVFYHRYLYTSQSISQSFLVIVPLLSLTVFIVCRIAWDIL